MKKFLLGSTMMLIASVLMAQNLRENEAVVVYYMPKTEFAIQMQYTVTTQTPGVFYQYAKRYLGAEQIITKASTQYSLDGIQISATTSADIDRAYQVPATKGWQTQLLSLTEDGRLLGYNIEANLPEPPVQVVNSSKHTVASTDVLPLLEEQFIAGTTAKMAEGAAKQIYRIREMRLNLLAGEVEHVPADGMAMQLVLDELNKREAELISLFVGTTTISSGLHTIHYTPQRSAKQEILCRFSQHTGVVDSNDLSGTPIYITLNTTKPTVEESEVPSSKTPLLSPIYYNLPAHTKIMVEYNGQHMCKASFPVAQFGVAVPLSIDLFSSKPTPSIHINPTTGNIQSIK
jgi:hypothetical protein